MNWGKAGLDARLINSVLHETFGTEARIALNNGMVVGLGHVHVDKSKNIVDM